MHMDFHEWRDLIETISTVSAILYGVYKFSKKVATIADIPEKVQELSIKIDGVDNKVNTLTGQFQVFREATRRH